MLRSIEMEPYCHVLIPGLGEGPRVGFMSPRELQVMELKAMGIANREIAWRLGISGDTVKNFVASALYKSGSNSVGTILALIESGGISRERVSQGLDFERYRYLSDIQKKVLVYLSAPDTIDYTCARIAYDLRMAEQTFKNHCGDIYRVLEIEPSLLRLRVFSALMPNNLTFDVA